MNETESKSPPIPKFCAVKIYPNGHEFTTLSRAARLVPFPLHSSHGEVELMAIKDGWVDWARVIPGIPDKVYSQQNKALGLIGHSIVGSYQSALDRFLSTARLPNGRYTRQAEASCMFIITFWGELIQMYPVTASPWTSGGPEANTGYWPIEMEGGAIGDESQALADLQVMATMRLCEEFEAHTGKKVLAGSTFREHGEIARQFGYAATACPSGRYKRFYEAWANRDRPVVVAAESGDRVAKLEQKLTALEALTATWRESARTQGITLP